MLYVKVVTPLVLKRWVWPMIKCSHLTPQSIYSYIDDLVIANCLIDARVFVHALPHILFCYLIVWACWVHDFIHSRTSICCFGRFDFFDQMDGQECLSTSPSYLCFLVSNSIHAYITNFEQVIFGPSGWGALGATDPSRANFQNLLVNFGQTNTFTFGPTETTRLI